MSFKPTSRKKAGAIFDILSSKGSDAATIANLTMPNESQKYNGGRLYERYEQLAPLHVDDTASAKSAFNNAQTKK